MTYNVFGGTLNLALSIYLKKTEKKDLDWHRKTWFKGNWYVLWGSTRALCRQRRLASRRGPMCLQHGM